MAPKYRKTWMDLAENVRDLASTYYIVSDGDPAKLLCDYKCESVVYSEASLLAFEVDSEKHREALYEWWTTNRDNVRVSNVYRLFSANTENH